MTVRVSNSAGGTEWIVTEGQETESFDSLYDLVTYLSARSQ